MSDKDEAQQRWTLFHTAVMALAKKSGFTGCVVAAFQLSQMDDMTGGHLFSATASDGEMPQDVIRAIHVVLAQRLLGLTDSDLAGVRPVAEA